MCESDATDEVITMSNEKRNKMHGSNANDKMTITENSGDMSCR